MSKKVKNIEDPNELEVTTVDPSAEVNKNLPPEEMNPLFPDLRQNPKAPATPETDHIVENAKADPNFKRAGTESVEIEATVYNPKNAQPIKRMELPDYEAPLISDLKAVDVRKSIPQVPEISDTVSYTPGMETQFLRPQNINIQGAPAPVDPSRPQVTVTDINSVPDVSMNVTVTNPDSHNAMDIQVQSSGGAVSLTSQQQHTIKTATVTRPSDELDSIMDRAMNAAAVAPKPQPTAQIDESALEPMIADPSLTMVGQEVPDTEPVTSLPQRHRPVVQGSPEIPTITVHETVGLTQPNQVSTVAQAQTPAVSQPMEAAEVQTLATIPTIDGKVIPGSDATVVSNEATALDLPTPDYSAVSSRTLELSDKANEGLEKQTAPKKKAPAKKSTAKKPAAKKSTAKKATTKKSTAKKATKKSTKKSDS